MAEVYPGKTNLSAWWTMKETSGTRYDSHGSNHGSPVGTIIQNPSGIKNGCVQPNPTGAIKVLNSSAIQLGGSNFTIGCWLYRWGDPASWGMLFSKRDSAEYFLGFASAGALVFAGNDSTKIQVTSPSKSAWHFVCCRFNGSTYYMTVDGSTSSASGTGFTATTANLGIGGNPSGTEWSIGGAVDEAFIYKRFLSDDEVSWLYNSGSGRTYSDLVPPVTKRKKVIWW